MYRPGDTYYKEFTTQRFDTGVSTNADSTPSITVNHNGTDDNTFSSAITVTNIDTGRYKVVGTIPSGYTVGDVINMTASATVNAISSKCVIDTFSIDTSRTSDIPGEILSTLLETGVTVQQSLEAIASVLAGNLDISNSQYKAIGNPSVNRVKFAIDVNGNRTITLTL